MGIRIDGTSDLINAADGSLTVEGLSINVSGVVTASDGFKVGSAATIFSNGNATFSGITTAASLVSSGTLNVSGESTLGTVSITDYIYHAGDSNTMIRFPAADTITAETGGSERLRIKSDGKVGINDTSPEELLDLGESNQQNLKLGQRGYLGQGYSTSATILGHSVKAKTTGTDVGGMIITETNSGGGAPSAIRMQNGNIEFHTASNGTADADFTSERLRIDESGNLKIVGVTTAADYHYATHPGITTMTGNASTNTLTISSGHSINSVLVFQNGICLTPGGDYTISGTTLTFQSVPVLNAEIVIRYLPK